jgi:hypothetical protein
MSVTEEKAKTIQQYFINLLYFIDFQLIVAFFNKC